MTSDQHMSTRRLFRRVVRYAVVGVAISALYTLSVIFLVALLGVQSATLASVLGFIAVVPIAYAVHRYVTFFDATHDTFQPVRFAVTTTSSFLVTTVGMYAVTEVFGFSYLIGIALNWALIPAINFAIYFVWVFRVAKPPFAAGTAPRSVGSLDGD